jgi:hypothetical protein
VSPSSTLTASKDEDVSLLPLKPVFAGAAIEHVIEYGSSKHASPKNLIFWADRGWVAPNHQPPTWISTGVVGVNTRAGRLGTRGAKSAFLVATSRVVPTETPVTAILSSSITTVAISGSSVVRSITAFIFSAVVRDCPLDISTLKAV